MDDAREYVGRERGHGSDALDLAEGRILLLIKQNRSIRLCFAHTAFVRMWCRPERTAHPPQEHLHYLKSYRSPLRICRTHDLAGMHAFSSTRTLSCVHRRVRWTRSFVPPDLSSDHTDLSSTATTVTQHHRSLSNTNTVLIWGGWGKKRAFWCPFLLFSPMHTDKNFIQQGWRKENCSCCINRTKHICYR